jgi:hypothetical protein
MTAKHKTKRRRKPAPKRRKALGDLPIAMNADAQTTTGDFSLHDLFQEQTMAMLERSDLSEEQRQSILVAMNCPCCGGSGLSFTMKLKRKK